ncbi:MAG: hypothetical protein A3F17_07955 [Gammaproteobacteria bacterium RIFCSPHIGHO2_12_FULL_41_15]|nr:MAG: hypothetical protein A3F17_07955 [Gammaproteobacteria bacterium RIFCSPHIGHO2_12_FULL_41_15]
MPKLNEKKCQACSGETKPLNAQQAKTLLADIPAWQLNATHTEISRSFTFKNYYHTIAFVNAIAWIANSENHHPDLAVGYNTCTVKFSTHSIKGLSENDFICAAKIDYL